MKGIFSYSLLHQGDMLLGFNNEVYIVIDNQRVIYKSKVKNFASIEPKIKSIKSKSITIAQRECYGSEMKVKS